ncbi:MAG: hypothetical protein ACFCBW_10695 [Candidatus Competibacterales bacterium]
MRPLNTTLAAFSLLAVAPATASETPIALDEVPEEIMAIAREIVASMHTRHTVDTALTFDDFDAADQPPGADDQPVTVTFVSANTETEVNGPDDFVYEIQGTLEDGRKVEFDIFPSGVVQEVEIEFSEAAVPGAVLQALERAYPGFTPSFIEATHTRSLKVVGYEFVGTMGDQMLDLEVSADGRRIVESDQ